MTNAVARTLEGARLDPSRLVVLFFSLAAVGRARSGAMSQQHEEESHARVDRERYIDGQDLPRSDNELTVNGG